jgi:iron complex outermembrane receptor protein
LGDPGTGVLVPQQFRFTANVPAVVDGIDLDAAFQLTEGWSMGLAASYADGHMENATIPCNAPIPPGQSIALCTGSDIAISTAPEWSANLSSEYSRSLTADLEGYVRGLFNYYPENDRASGEGSGFTADAYGLLNLFAGVRSADGAWDVQLFARNVTDTQKTLTLNSNMERSSVSPIALNFGPTGYFETGFTPKREFGVTVRYSFGSR